MALFKYPSQIREEQEGSFGEQLMKAILTAAATSAVQSGIEGGIGGYFKDYYAQKQEGREKDWGKQLRAQAIRDAGIESTIKGVPDPATQATMRRMRAEGSVEPEMERQSQMFWQAHPDLQKQMLVPGGLRGQQAADERAFKRGEREEGQKFKREERTQHEGFLREMQKNEIKAKGGKKESEYDPRKDYRWLKARALADKAVQTYTGMPTAQNKQAAIDALNALRSFEPGGASQAPPQAPAPAPASGAAQSKATPTPEETKEITSWWTDRNGTPPNKVQLLEFYRNGGLEIVRSNPIGAE